MRNKTVLIIFFLAALAVLATLALAEPSWAGKLEEAIAKTPQGIGKGMIDPSAKPGFMGIPGAPHHFWLFYILWGIWVGWIFSSVGAFGGIMAGVGHITGLDRQRPLPRGVPARLRKPQGVLKARRQVEHEIARAHAGLSRLAAALEASRTMRGQTLDLVIAARELRRIKVPD